MIPTVELSKQTKQALKGHFKSVSVRRGSGTASGWISAYVTIERPSLCGCDPKIGSRCESCQNAYRAAYNRCSELTKHIEYHRYFDDGNEWHQEINFHIEFATDPPAVPAATASEVQNVN